MASSVASCLSSVGYDMPRAFDVMPLLEIDSIVEALTAQLQDVGSAALYCPREAPTRAVYPVNVVQLRKQCVSKNKERSSGTVSV
ncbi:TPA: hypothetical protein ACH3X1_006912 [Trebouxia sp. C0004]